jgi:hypothetical protein
LGKLFQVRLIRTKNVWGCASTAIDIEEANKLERYAVALAMFT